MLFHQRKNKAGDYKRRKGGAQSCSTSVVHSGLGVSCRWLLALLLSFLATTLVTDAQECPMTIMLFVSIENCTTNPFRNGSTPIAQGTVYADNVCHTVETEIPTNSTIYESFPGNYRAGCTAEGKVHFTESGCLSEKCYVSHPDNAVCERDFSPDAKAYLYSDPTPPEYQIQEAEDKVFHCTKLAGREGIEVVFAILGDCTDPGCVIITPTTPSTAPTSPTSEPTKTLDDVRVAGSDGEGDGGGGNFTSIIAAVLSATAILCVVVLLGVLAVRKKRREQEAREQATATHHDETTGPSTETPAPAVDLTIPVAEAIPATPPAQPSTIRAVGYLHLEEEQDEELPSFKDQMRRAPSSRDRVDQRRSSTSARRRHGEQDSTAPSYTTARSKTSKALTDHTATLRSEDFTAPSSSQVSQNPAATATEAAEVHIILPEYKDQTRPVPMSRRRQSHSIHSASARPDPPDEIKPVG